MIYIHPSLRPFYSIGDKIKKKVSYSLFNHKITFSLILFWIEISPEKKNNQRLLN